MNIIHRHHYYDDDDDDDDAVGHAGKYYCPSTRHTEAPQWRASSFCRMFVTFKFNAFMLRPLFQQEHFQRRRHHNHRHPQCLPTITSFLITLGVKTAEMSKATTMTTMMIMSVIKTIFTLFLIMKTMHRHHYNDDDDYDVEDRASKYHRPTARRTDALPWRTSSFCWPCISITFSAFMLTPHFNKKIVVVVVITIIVTSAPTQPPSCHVGGENCRDVERDDDDNDNDHVSNKDDRHNCLFAEYSAPPSLVQRRRRLHRWWPCQYTSLSNLQAYRDPSIVVELLLSDVRYFSSMLMPSFQQEDCHRRRHHNHRHLNASMTTMSALILFGEGRGGGGGGGLKLSRCQKRQP